MRMIDGHTHLMNRTPEKLLAMADGFGYESISVMSIPCHDRPVNTLECMMMKLKAPERVYCYGGMTYTETLKPTGDCHLKQLEMMMEAGCDGWKILESKPSYFANLQMPLDGEVFAKSFAMAEAEQIPIVWHAGDPATFWDASTAPAFAVENNWLCIGEGYPTLEEIYRQVEAVMARHPKLNAALAHLYFISDDRAHGERMLDTYENFWLDITPGSEMYQAFMDDREGWTAFFNKYQDRLLFGTDMVDDEIDFVFGSQSVITGMVFKTLIEDKPFRVVDIAGTGLGLDESVLNKVFHDNFVRRNGPKPRPINRKGVEAYAEWLMPWLNKEDRKFCEELMK